MKIWILSLNWRIVWHFICIVTFCQSTILAVSRTKKDFSMFFVVVCVFFFFFFFFFLFCFFFGGGGGWRVLLHFRPLLLFSFDIVFSFCFVCVFYSFFSFVSYVID